MTNETREIAVRTIAGPDELLLTLGEEMGVSPWLLIEQSRIDAFAKATDDLQWIHVDPTAAAAGPFGTTIAHGFLTLALVPIMLKQIYTVSGFSMTINYGSDRVRLMSPVPVGSRIRTRAVMSEISEVTGGLQIKVTATVEIDGQVKPACVVELILRYMF